MRKTENIPFEVIVCLTFLDLQSFFLATQINKQLPNMLGL